MPRHEGRRGALSRVTQMVDGRAQPRSGLSLTLGGLTKKHRAESKSSSDRWHNVDSMWSGELIPSGNWR